VLYGKVSKFSITFILCICPDSAPCSISRVLRDHRQLKKSESELICCHRGLFGVLVCSLYSMDEMLICFSFGFDRWTTTPMPPSEPTDGSVVTGWTAPVFPPCSEMCYTALAMRGLPRTVVARTVSLGLGTTRSMCTFQLTPLTRP
jgi:hypothetical protein